MVVEDRITELNRQLNDALKKHENKLPRIIRKHFCEQFVELAFEYLELPMNDHRVCFNRCVQQLSNTNWDRCTTWSTWHGGRHILKQMREINERAEQDQNKYALTAELGVSVLVVRILRGIEGEARGELIRLLDFHQWYRRLANSILSFDPRNPTTFIKIQSSSRAANGRPLGSTPMEPVIHLDDDDDIELIIPANEAIPTSDISRPDNDAQMNMLHGLTANYTVSTRQSEQIVPVIETGTITELDVMARNKHLFDKIVIGQPTIYQLALAHQINDALDEHSMRVLNPSMRHGLVLWAESMGVKFSNQLSDLGSSVDEETYA